MQKNKYIHTEKDKEEDMLLIKEFTKNFEDKFKDQLQLSVYNLGELDGMEDYRYCVYDDLLLRAETVYIMHNNMESIMIWLETGINPNGISDNIIARTFDIKYQKRIKEQILEKFFDYSTDSNEVIREFERFLQKKK